MTPPVSEDDLNDLRDEDDRAAILAELEREDALASRYDPPADPQAKCPYTGAIICYDCQVEIPQERLAAIPNAVRCVDCQRQEEKEQWQRRLNGQYGD
jgi:RNA polymerase-binding transcription factor DksA